MRRYGVVQAVRSFVEKLKLVTNINFEIHTDLKDRLPEIIEFTVYRALIELINNSIKHGEATNINIKFSDLSNQFQINYVEDGVGFLYQKMKYNGFGLMNIESRIKKIGGYYNLISAPGEGVQVEIGIKIRNND